MRLTKNAFLIIVFIANGIITWSDDGKIYKSNQPSNQTNNYDEQYNNDRMVIKYTHKRLGDEAFQRQDYSSAVPHYFMCIDNKPEINLCYIELIKSLNRLGKKAEAMKIMAKYDKLFKSINNDKKGVYLSLKGINYDECFDSSKITDILPEVAILKYHEGESARKSGAIKKAIELYVQCLQKDPTVIDCYNALISLYSENGETQMAKSCNKVLFHLLNKNTVDDTCIHDKCKNDNK